MRGAHVIRVLIADEIARIVGDLEKLAPYGDVIDVCGVAHQASSVIEEAWLRQPDVLVLHEGFAELPAADFAAHLGSVSPSTRVLLMTAGDAPAVTDAWTAPDGQRVGRQAPELLEAIRIAAGEVPPEAPARDSVVPRTRAARSAPRKAARPWSSRSPARAAPGRR